MSNSSATGGLLAGLRALGGILTAAGKVLAGAASIGLYFTSDRNADDDRTADQIISEEKQASIRREFPGEMLDKTLGEIKRIARDKKSEEREAARKAKKLLTDKRFDKDS